MARTISDEELQLKQRARRRLIGAIVLVAAIIVVLPMVLDTEPRQAGQSLSVQIPSPESGAFKSRVVPPAPPSAPEPVPAPKLEPASGPKPETGPPVKPAASAATAAAKPAAPAKASETSKSGPFAVQVIALADAARAKQMQEKIEAAGIPSYTEIVKTAKGDVTRVRAGPFASRVAADKALEKLKSLGMNGNVITR